MAPAKTSRTIQSLRVSASPVTAPPRRGSILARRSLCTVRLAAIATAAVSSGVATGTQKQPGRTERRDARTTTRPRGRLSLHACPARCGARRRCGTAKLCSAPCLPLGTGTLPPPRASASGRACDARPNPRQPRILDRCWTGAWRGRCGMYRATAKLAGPSHRGSLTTALSWP